MRRRDLLRGMFVIAVACPAIASNLARANPRPPRPKPRPRPSSQLHPPVPRFVPPDGLPLVDWRCDGHTIDVLLSNPHGRFIAFECITTAAVHAGVVAITTRVRNWTPTGWYVYATHLPFAGETLTVRTIVGGNAETHTHMIMLPEMAAPAIVTNGIYNLGPEAPCPR